MLEVGIVRRLVSIGPTELSVILKSLTYRGVLICLRVKNHTDSWGSSQTIEEIGEKKNIQVSSLNLQLISEPESFSVHEHSTFFPREVFDSIDLVTISDTIFTSRQTREKLQCLYENLMSNNFRRTAVLKKI